MTDTELLNACEKDWYRVARNVEYNDIRMCWMSWNVLTHGWDGHNTFREALEAYNRQFAIKVSQIES